jgi:putative transposase
MKKEDPIIYRRRLPHIQPSHGTFWVTFNLKGAITSAMRASMKDELELELLKIRRACPNKEEYKREAARAHEAFIYKYDAILDQGLIGARWLENPAVAAEVRESLSYVNGNLCRLIAWCIMPNHVHLVADEISIPLFRIMQRMKVYTARRANLILDRVGQPFWQSESFDHLVRDDFSLVDKIRYTIFNPVNAGLCQHWQDWPWTEVHEDFAYLIENTYRRSTDH